MIKLKIILNFEPLLFLSVPDDVDVFGVPGLYPDYHHGVNL